MWLAGGGIKAGITHGETDDFSYNVVKDPVDVHDLHATLLHCLGVDHTRLTFKFQGRNHRLTDVHGSVRELLAYAQRRGGQLTYSFPKTRTRTAKRRFSPP